MPASKETQMLQINDFHHLNPFFSSRDYQIYLYLWQNANFRSSRVWLPYGT